jgi:hypothetical protein
MGIGKTYHVDRARDSASDALQGRCARNGEPPQAKPRGPMIYPAVWDPERDSPALKKGAPSGPVWLVLVDIAARVALALFLTAGFAVALNLYAGLTMGSPDMIRACVWVFLWVLVLVSCGSPRRA